MYPPAEVRGPAIKKAGPFTRAECPAEVRGPNSVTFLAAQSTPENMAKANLEKDACFGFIS